VKFAAVVAVALLVVGCHLQVSSSKKKPFKASASFGVNPPTNAIIAVTVKKIGIVVAQNPATQAPEVTVGYSSATYHRVPIFGTNVPNVDAEIGTDQTGFNTEIHERFRTGNTTNR
jgi:hypothetical protein